MLIAVTLPFVVPFSLPPASASASSRAFYEAVERVPASSPVLVSIDWEAGQLGEMEPLTRGVVRRLLARDLRVLAMSLAPQGPALAQRLLDEEGARLGRRYGDHYLNLGFIPGNEPALVSFATAIRTAAPQDYRFSQSSGSYAALAGVERAADVALIVVIAADDAAPTRWVQQIGTRLPVPLVVAVSAGAGPLIAPYARGDRPQIKGTLIGLAGANEYASLTGDSATTLWTRLLAQSTGQAILVAAIVLGNVVWLGGHLWRRLRPREGAADENRWETA
ncbi:MAG: hypothetical protein HYY04_05795 [Chloroflexi bacterium]|nr:hypothetical protein [Chloroflexota bacterium]